MFDQIAQAMIQLEKTDEPPGFVATYVFPDTWPMFAGHFPHRPILPGVFEIEMVRVAMDQLTGRSHQVHQVVTSKFTREVKPNENIEVRATCVDVPAGCKVSATAHVGDEPAAKVTLVLGEK